MAKLQLWVSHGEGNLEQSAGPRGKSESSGSTGSQLVGTRVKESFAVVLQGDDYVVLNFIPREVWVIRVNVHIVRPIAEEGMVVDVKAGRNKTKMELTLG